ncbi:hypothetical protein MD588_02245 [Photobacterium sp. SDRW27]|uniref:hypothetical protein n=1 Tax=Photobacterium obscurum TaxID=2829490 RepID=UPI002244AE7D|nr:hypothetical protein [Photobacterium obscurum]MCW8327624.1 hypothetical protein [Photobacterium obscurum]
MYRNMFCLFGILGLAACGGGGSDSGTTSAGNSLQDPYSSNSSDYQPSQLRSSFIYSNSTITGMGSPQNATTIVGKLTYERNSERDVYLTGEDRFVILVDGVEVLPEMSGSSYYTFNVSEYGNNYEITWYRGDDVIAQSSFDFVPQAFDITSTYDGSAMNYTWSEQSNHIYTFVYPSLYCTKGNQSFNMSYSPTDDWRDNVVEGGSLSLELDAAFNTSESTLRSQYDSCDSTMDIIATRSDMTLVNSSPNMTVSVWAMTTDTQNIF